jgi:hypothetical protein
MYYNNNFFIKTTGSPILRKQRLQNRGKGQTLVSAMTMSGEEKGSKNSTTTAAANHNHNNNNNNNNNRSHFDDSGSLIGLKTYVTTTVQTPMILV